MAIQRLCQLAAYLLLLLTCLQGCAAQVPAAVLPTPSPTICSIILFGTATLQDANASDFAGLNVTAYLTPQQLASALTPVPGGSVGAHATSDHLRCSRLLSRRGCMHRGLQLASSAAELMMIHADTVAQH